MTGNYSLVREYVMSYTPSVTPGDGTALGVSLLTIIQQYGTDADSGGASLELTTFTYTGTNASKRGLAGFPDAMSLSSSSFMQLTGCDPTTDNGACKWQTFVGDIDGDGRADIVRAYYGQSGGYVQYTCGANDGFSGPVLTQTNSPSNQPQYLFAMGDINGDGKQDLVAAFPNSTSHTISTYIAFGGANCSLGPWQLVPLDSLQTDLPMSFYNPSPGPNEYPESRLPPNGNWHLRNWRILAADINGDGLTDVVLFDNGSRILAQCLFLACFYAPMSNRVLYYKLSTGTSLAPAQFSAAANFGAAGDIPRWTTTENASFFAYQTHHPDCVIGIDFLLNGITAADVNGDGRADIIASWSSANAQVVGDSPPPPPSRLFMTALGGANGLGTPLESGWIDNVPLAGTEAAPFWPYMSMRVGDINGDGPKDILFSFQGFAGDTGYGRYLQSWLGSSSATAFGLSTAVPLAQALFLDAQDTSTYRILLSFVTQTLPITTSPT